MKIFETGLGASWYIEESNKIAFLEIQAQISPLECLKVKLPRNRHTVAPTHFQKQVGRGTWLVLFQTSTLIGSQVPQPTFGSGLGLQCVYTVVISLWGTPAAKFVLESPKMVFYWIAPCIRKPQAKFHKFATTHVSPSSHWKPSTQSPLSPSTHLQLLNVYFSPFAYICISHRSFCLISTISQKSSVTHS